MFQNKMSDTARQVTRHCTGLPVPVGSCSGEWGGGRDGGEQRTQDLLPHGDSKNEPAADFAGHGMRAETTVMLLCWRLDHYHVTINRICDLLRRAKVSSKASIA